MITRPLLLCYQVINTATTTFIDCLLCAWAFVYDVSHMYLKLITLGHSFRLLVLGNQSSVQFKTLSQVT